MASSFITKDKKTGFWIYDGLFQVTCGFISKTLSLKNHEIWVDDFNVLLKDNAEGHFPGFMHLDFENIFTDEDRIVFFVNVLEDVKDHLLSKGQLISVEELNSFIINEDLQGEWYEPLEVARVIRVLECLHKILQDKIYSQIDNPWFDDIPN